MGFIIESSITGLTNSASTSERFDVKHNFETGVTVYKKDILPNGNNNFTAQYIVIVSHFSKDIFVFDTETHRNDFYDSLT